MSTSRTVPQTLDDVHPQNLRVGSEGVRKKLAEQQKVKIGRLVERALELMPTTKQAAAIDMGYTDQGVVSRWCRATERPLLDHLFTLPGFEEAWLLAQAETNPRVEVVTEIRVKRSA